MVGRNQYGYITPAFLGSPWWGEINLVRSECGGNERNEEMKLGENPNIPYPECERSIKIPVVKQQ